MWHLTPDTWHLTHDTWHVTCDIWHVTCDTWWGVNILSKCHLLWFGRDSFLKKVSQIMTNWLHYLNIYSTTKLFVEQPRLNRVCLLSEQIHWSKSICIFLCVSSPSKEPQFSGTITNSSTYLLGNTDLLPNVNQNNTPSLLSFPIYEIKTLTLVTQFRKKFF